jgi:coenzyme F420-reducing hydrogenase alpha subunit
MEHYVLELLQKLATLIPNWIHLRSLPSSLSTTTKETKPKKPDAPPATQQSSTMDRKTMRSSIIVIRNDGVDYAKDVRAKLGGRSYHQSNSLDQGGKSDNIVNKKKRSLKEFMGKQNAVADAIVPPSFRKRYDKMLKE